jgi:hypothetical protein
VCEHVGSQPITRIAPTYGSFELYLDRRLNRASSYADLAERLTAMGVKENEKNVNNKIARGGFTAAFFLQCMEAIGVHNIHLNSD